jgi:two-component system phosphate regulon response regulator OmpR
MSLARRSILSVDHNEDTCLMLSTLLTQQGYSVTTAAGSEEALSIAHREAFNLYVLDLMMPEVDGAQLCRMIRQFDPHTPIIIYSGAVLDINIEEALRAGADAFVAKPHIQELIETIKALLLL